MQPKTKVERPKTIGGSDAVRIMEGDWHTLWKEKTGRQEPKDLSRVLPVQLGILSETLNISNGLNKKQNINYYQLVINTISQMIFATLVLMEW